MPFLSFNRVRGRLLRLVDWSLEPGLHALVGGPEDEAAELVALAAGIVAPRKGVVRLGAARPHRSPGARRAIGALLRDEEALEPRTTTTTTVQEAVRSALELHGVPELRSDVFEALGLEGLLGRRASALSSEETRAVALGVSLSVPLPELLVLHEPFTVSAHRGALSGLLSRRAAEGAVVLLALASDSEARELGARVRTLGANPGRPSVTGVGP